MNAEASPDPGTWRDGDCRAAPAYGFSPHRAQSMCLSAPTAINPATQSAILQTNYVPRWDRITGSAASERRPSLPFEQPPRAEPCTVTFHSRTLPQGRHSPTPGGNHGPAPLGTTSPRQNVTGAWRSLPDDHRAGMNNLTDAPPSLHIPRTQGTTSYYRASPSSLPSSPQVTACLNAVTSH